MTNKTVILYSGGLDSFILREYAQRVLQLNPISVFFDYGQPYLKKELAALPEDVIVHKIDWLKEHSVTGQIGGSEYSYYITNRNLSLISLAASIYTPNLILTAFYHCTDERSTDANTEFLTRANDLLKYIIVPYYTSEFSVEAPFSTLGWGGKLEAIQWALSVGIIAEQLLATSSCFDPHVERCGVCDACFNRWLALSANGIEETYTEHPLDSARYLPVVKRVISSDSANRDFMLPIVKRYLGLKYIEDVLAEVNNRILLLGVKNE